MASALTIFGDRCRRIRIARGLSMMDQARATTCSVVEIASVEAGETYPTPKYVEAFCKWLGLDPAEQANLLVARPKRDNVIPFRPSEPKHSGKNMRMFRKLSKMSPEDIRAALSLPGCGHD